MRWRNVIVIAVAAALVVNLAPLFGPSFGAELDYQNRVMIELDRRTRERDRVWDGCGFALRREPAYRYWFLPAGVRLLAQANLIEPYDREQMEARPPAAIVYDLRTRFWMTAYPRLRTYAMHHYVPLYQHLWIPGMSALVESGPSSIVWTVPIGGRYDVILSEMLAKHPWFSRPLDYGVMEGTELEIPLNRMEALAPELARWQVDGIPVTVRNGMLDLRAGARLELRSSLPRRAGIVIVPHGVTTLSVMPDVPMVF